MNRFLSFCTCVLLACLFSLPLYGQEAALAAQRNLDVLTSRAATIVRGHVKSAQIEPHPQFKHLMTLAVTMQVDSVLKGSADKEFTFRQYVWDVRAQYNKAGYLKGQELLLLLNPVSEYGLTSPAGMDQGRFFIQRKADGTATVVNGVNNAGLFKGMAEASAKKGVTLSSRSRAMVQSTASGPVPLSDLEDTIRALVKGTAGGQ